MSRWKCLWSTAILSLLCLRVCAIAQSCAYGAVNGNCLLTLDRMNPVSPPTIFVRRGDHVTILVTNALPFEHLTVDLKSAAAQMPADQFRNAFTDITTALDGLEIVGAPGGAPAAGVAAPQELTKQGVAPAQASPSCPEHPTTVPDFKQCQSYIAKQLDDWLKIRDISDPPGPTLNFATWVYSRLCSIHILFVPLPSSAVSPQDSITVCRDLPPDITPLYIPENGPDLVKWKKAFNVGSDVIAATADSLKGTSKDRSPGLNDKIAGLDADLADAKRDGTISAGNLLMLKTAQQVLHGAADTISSLLSKTEGIMREVNELSPYDGPNPITITDLHGDEKNNEVQVWDLNASNRLASVAGQVKADKYGDKIVTLVGSLAETPTKQTVVEFKIEFLNEPRLEISSGILVPFRPYHSFSEATPYSSATSTVGSCTAGTTGAPLAPTNCPIVQQSLTVAFVPEVSFNILLGHELVLGKQRGAWMWTIAVGYNSATTSAAFGTGISFAYRSMVFSLLPLADRDEHLTGGYQVNQSAGTATAPTTANGWRVNPSFGISLRLPVGGGS